MVKEKGKSAVKRIYAVTGEDGQFVLVKATNPSTAIRHVVRGKFTAKVASQQQCVDAALHGVQVAGETDE